MSDGRLAEIQALWESRRWFDWVDPAYLPMENTPPEVVDVLDLLDEVERLREALTITDEMVERVAVALFRASTDEDWETGPDESERDEWRAQARVAIAAMGVQK